MVTKELATGVPIPEDVRSRFAFEARINEYMARNPPPVAFAPLVATESGGSVMRFQAIEGHPIGPKWGARLPDAVLNELADLASQLQAYAPFADWIPRYDPAAELARRLDEGVIDAEEFEQVNAFVATHPWRRAFAHGDFTPRNVLASASGLVLIDWEFAGWYPIEYDRAFLWMVLGETPGARASLEAAVPDGDRLSFWLCAYLIQRFHLGMWAKRGDSITTRFPHHLETKRHVFTELLSAADNA